MTEENLDTKEFGVNPSALEGLTVVITGKLSKIDRRQAEALVERAGGKATGSISAKTDLLVAGENAGSKLQKAESLNIEILNEDEFLSKIENKKMNKEEGSQAIEISTCSYLHTFSCLTYPELKSYIEENEEARKIVEKIIYTAVFDEDNTELILDGVLKLKNACKTEERRYHCPYIDTIEINYPEEEEKNTSLSFEFKGETAPDITEVFEKEVDDNFCILSEVGYKRAWFEIEGVDPFLPDEMRYKDGLITYKGVELSEGDYADCDAETHHIYLYGECICTVEN